LVFGKDQSNGHVFNIGRNGNDFNDPGVMTYDFNVPLSDLNFSIRDLDLASGGSEEVEVRAYYQGLEVLPTSKTIGVNINEVSPLTFQALTSNTSTTSYDNGVIFDYSGSLIDQMVVTQLHTNNYANQGILYTFESACIAIDTDGDGTPNYQDLDSDNDGCFDAIEGDGGVTLAQIDANGQITGGVDADGVPNTVSPGQADVSSTDPAVTSPNCDDDGDGVINSADICPGYDDTADADNDTLPNGCDLDDDNDGILDTEEMICIAPNVIDYSSNPAGTDLKGFTYITGNGGLEVSHSITGNFGIWEGPEANGQVFNIGRNGTDFNDPGVMTYDFNIPLSDLNFSIRDLDLAGGGSEEVEVRAYYQGVEVLPTSKTIGVNITEVSSLTFPGRQLVICIRRPARPARKISCPGFIILLEICFKFTF